MTPKKLLVKTLYSILCSVGFLPRLVLVAGSSEFIPRSGDADIIQFAASNRPIILLRRSHVAQGVTPIPSVRSLVKFGRLQSGGFPASRGSGEYFVVRIYGGDAPDAVR